MLSEVMLHSNPWDWRTILRSREICKSMTPKDWNGGAVWIAESLDRKGIEAGRPHHHPHPLSSTSYGPDLLPLLIYTELNCKLDLVWIVAEVGTHGDCGRAYGHPVTARHPLSYTMDPRSASHASPTAPSIRLMISFSHRGHLGPHFTRFRSSREA
nr:hypothetical protein CFP56_22037 [Quercus suber]